MRTVHYAVEVLTFDQPLCENQRGVDVFAGGPNVEMTTFDEEVTCQECLRALGYALPDAITNHVHEHGFSTDADVHSRRAA